MKNTIIRLCVASFYASNIYASPFEDMNSPLYKAQEHCGQLSARVLGQDIFSASAVYLGGKTILTAAHCVELWLNKDGELNYPLNFRVDFNDGHQSYHNITKVITHPEYDKNNFDNDLAILITSDAIEGLDGVTVNYDLPTILPQIPQVPHLNFNVQDESHEDSMKKLGEFQKEMKFFNEQLDLISNIRKPFESYIVGYGMKKIIFGSLGYNDGTRKTGVFYNSSASLSGAHPNNLSCIFSVCGLDFSADQGMYIERDLLPYERAASPGDSGGPQFNKDGELIGISSNVGIVAYRGVIGNTASKISNKLLYQYTKYLSAMGVPVPTIFLSKGESSFYVNLSLHKDWIEGNRQ